MMFQAVQKIHTCNLSTAIFAPGLVNFVSLYSYYLLSVLLIKYLHFSDGALSAILMNHILKLMMTCGCLVLSISFIVAYATNSTKVMTWNYFHLLRNLTESEYKFTFRPIFAEDMGLAASVFEMYVNTISVNTKLTFSRIIV